MTFVTWFESANSLDYLGARISFSQKAGDLYLGEKDGKQINNHKVECCRGPITPFTQCLIFNINSSVFKFSLLQLLFVDTLLDHLIINFKRSCNQEYETNALYQNPHYEGKIMDNQTLCILFLWFCSEFSKIFQRTKSKRGVKVVWPFHDERVKKILQTLIA